MDEIVEMARIIEEQENDKSAYQSRNFQRIYSALTLNGHQKKHNTSPAKAGESTPARKSFDSPRDSRQGDQKHTVQNPCRHCKREIFCGASLQGFPEVQVS